MINGLTPSGKINHSECEVCGSAITYHDALSLKPGDATVCRSFECRRIMQQKDSMSPLMFKSHLAFQKKRLKSHRDKVAARLQRISQVEQIQDKEHKRILASLLKKHSNLCENSVQTVVIPRGLSKPSKPEPERIETYVAHLQSIIAKAQTFHNASEVDFDQHHAAREKLQLVEKRFAQHPALRTMSDRLCAMCKGGCCRSGKEHAYLSVFSVRALMDKNPQKSAKDIVELYRSHISANTIKGSCINQTPTGCALPRALRSDICNAFYCDALKHYQQKPSAHSPDHTVLAIQRSNTYSSWIDPDEKNDIIGFELIRQTDANPN